VILRRAVEGDARDIAIVHCTAMRISLSFLPEVHSDEEDLRFFSERVLPTNEVWVADADGEAAGYIAFDDDWIHHLYLLPRFQAQGIGPQLLALALADGRTRRLWTFQQNDRARRFYEARGFVLLQLTDGSGNEEKTPDALYEWRAKSTEGL
jgi:GNAT superfamily N-acetyltransferase